MKPPSVNSRVSAAIDVQPQVDSSGAIVQVVMVKQRYAIGGGVAWPVPGAEVLLVDKLWSDDPPGSVQIPGDLSLSKPGTDVVVVGEAQSLGAVPVESVDVLVQVGSMRKALRAFGRRVWYEGPLGLTLTPPEPFVRTSLRWEDAWGGSETLPDGRSAHDPRNPFGRGVAPDSSRLVHQEGPSIEDPDDLIVTVRTRPEPAGVAALSPGAPARARYAGTMNQHWLDTRFPLRPADFDPRFFHCAVPELRSPTPLSGHEPVSITGMHPSGPVIFRLPRRSLFVGAEIDGHLLECPPRLDTAVIYPNDLFLDLTWRSVIATPRPQRRLRAVFVYDKERVG